MNIIHIVYKRIFKPFFFTFTNPEKIHDFMLLFGAGLGKSSIIRSITSKLLSYQNEALKQTIKGIDFSNPVGLSAGFDKNADMINIFPSIGFGFAQIGTITNMSYKGNPKPRLYRLPKSKSILVNYGLKNIGVDAIIKKINNRRHDNVVLSMSIGRTNCKETADPEFGINDIHSCFQKIIDSNLGNFYTLNISCPNLYGGNSFTTADSLRKLLEKIYTLDFSKPLFIKMPINLPWNEFKSLLDVAIDFKVDGVIIGNINKDRNDPLIKDKIPEHIKGFASGLPTQKLSTELISKTYNEYHDSLIIIGVGGIFSAQDAYEKIKKGASLVQLITGLVYEGPQLVGQINKGLVSLLRKDGYNNIHEAIGSYHKN